jgi:glycosyltransferase involved in cell wall biosynthesis
VGATPLVSVVIPTYGRSDRLEAAVTAAFAQTWRPIEVIVVDDNPRESDARRATAAVAARLVESLGLVYVEHERNMGGGAARNTGARRARGEYLAFLDDDDRWAPSKLEKQVAVFAASAEDIGLVYTGLNIVDGSGRLLRYRPAVNAGRIASRLALFNVVGTTSSVMMPRRIFDEVGGFDPAFPARQDLDLWFRVALSRPVACIDEPLTDFVHHDDTRITKRVRGLLAARALFLEKHAGWFAEHPRDALAYLRQNVGFCLRHGFPLQGARWIGRYVASALTRRLG